MRRLLPLAFPIAFLICGLAFLPYPGLQNDEVVFVRALFDPRSARYHVQVFGHEIPILFLTYLGALKSWLWAPVFRVFRPSVWSIRLPSLLLGAVTVWLVFLLLERMHSRRAAWIGAALLATDSCFLLTTCFDWGPVMLQHLLLTAAMLCGVTFWKERSTVWLAFCFFCAGLALWDKALALWMLSGMTLALLVVFPRELRCVFTWRRAAVAAAAFAAGAFPLLLYNATHDLATFRSNAHLDLNAGRKVSILAATLNGWGLFAYLVNYEGTPNPRMPRTSLEKLSFALHSITGDCQFSGMTAAYAAALLMCAWLMLRPSRRILLFCFITFAVAWVQMFLSKDAGASVHHTILLWPLPAMIVAIAFASVPFPRVAAVATGLLVLMNLLNINQYLYQFARFGPRVYWTDAMNVLWADVSRMHGTRFFVLDWDIELPLKALSRTRLPVLTAWDWFQGDALTPRQRARALSCLSQPDAMFLLHTPDKEIFHHVNENLDAVAAEGGYRRSAVYTWADGNGRPVFLGIRFVHDKPQPAPPKRVD